MLLKRETEKREWGMGNRKWEQALIKHWHLIGKTTPAQRNIQLRTSSNSIQKG